MRRKETSLLVESWRSFINENEMIAKFEREQTAKKLSNNEPIIFGDDGLSAQEGGVFQKFYEKEFPLNNLSNPKGAWSQIGHQQANRMHTGSNIKDSGLSMKDVGMFKDLTKAKYGAGIYYVTKTGVWCYPYIGGDSNNTQRDALKFKGWLKSNGFKEVDTSGGV